MPVTFQPRRNADKMTARMTAFRPGASPPPVLTRMCMEPKAISRPDAVRNWTGRLFRVSARFRLWETQNSRSFAEAGNQDGAARSGGRHGAQVNAVDVSQHGRVQRLGGWSGRGDGAFLHHHDAVAVRRGQVH